MASWINFLQFSLLVVRCSDSMPKAHFLALFVSPSSFGSHEHSCTLTYCCWLACYEFLLELEPYSCNLSVNCDTTILNDLSTLDKPNRALIYCAIFITLLPWQCDCALGIPCWILLGECVTNEVNYLNLTLKRLANNAISIRCLTKMRQLRNTSGPEHYAWTFLFFSFPCNRDIYLVSQKKKKNRTSLRFPMIYLVALFISYIYWLSGKAQYWPQ